jgi:hypothetical protein
MLLKKCRLYLEEQLLGALMLVLSLPNHHRA